MSLIPTQWGSLFGGLVLEILLVVALALVLQRRVSAAHWRRTLWQVVLLGVAGILFLELSGTKRLAIPSRPLAAPPADVKVTLQTSTTTLDLKTFAERLKQAMGAADSLPKTGAARPTEQIGSWIPWLWLTGSVTLGLWVLGSRLAFVCFVRRKRTHDDALLLRAQDLARQLGLRRRISITEIRGLSAPIAFGLFRPGIGLPEKFCERFSLAQQDAMLAHELAHLASRDPWWLLCADGLAALLWWNPFVWVARRQLRIASEAAADEASRLVKNGPVVLAECLVELGKRLTPSHSLGWLGMEGSGFRSGLGRRVERLVSLRDQPWAPMRKRAHRLAKTFGCLALLAVVLAATAWLQPREARADSFQHAFRESALGLVLAAAMPAPQAETVVRTVNNQPVDTGEGLHTRWFKIDTRSFGSALRGLLGAKAASTGTNFNNSEALLEDMRQVLQAAGAEFNPPRNILLNPVTGMLMARATLPELDAVESMVQILSMSPPQITLEVQLCEISEEAEQRLRQHPILGPGLLAPSSIPAASTPSSTTNAVARTASNILTASQYQEVMEALKLEPGVQVLTTPKVTTLSGHQCQIKAVRVRYIVTDLDIDTPESRTARSPKTNPGTTTTGGATDSTNQTATIQPIAEPFELGPVVDMVPYVDADGFTISMTVIATIKEFLGYDRTGDYLAAVKVGQDAPFTQIVPLPNFQLRQVMAGAKVLDGQTLVLAGGKAASNPIHQPGTTTASSSENKSLLIFVTPTIIDPAGNRVHRP